MIQNMRRFSFILCSLSGTAINWNICIVNTESVGGCSIYVLGKYSKYKVCIEVQSRFFKGGHKLNCDAYETACMVKLHCTGNADMHWREKTHFCILGI